jgi:hypothetical protein
MIIKALNEIWRDSRERYKRWDQKSIICLKKWKQTFSLLEFSEIIKTTVNKKPRNSFMC